MLLNRKPSIRCYFWPLIDAFRDASSVTTAMPSLSSARGSRIRRRREERLQDEARMAEILALQQSLAAMEDFFQSLLGQAQLHFVEQAFDPQNGGNQGPPPASCTLVLPKVSSPLNEMCGVCSEPLAKLSTRMPCGHLLSFHIMHRPMASTSLYLPSLSIRSQDRRRDI